MKNKVIGVVTAALCVLGGTAPYMPASSMISAQAVDYIHEIKSDDGYTFSISNTENKGTISYQEGEHGTLKGSWDGIKNGIIDAGVDLRKNSAIVDINIDYKLDIAMDSYTDTDKGISNVCYYGAYGCFNDGGFETLPTEFYIIEGWNNWRPPANNASSVKKLGEVTSNGATYELYKTKGMGPGYGGDIYWSVRKESSMKEGEVSSTAKICVKDHMDEWKKIGMREDIKLEYVSFEINANNCSFGAFDLKKNDINIDAEGDSSSFVLGDLNGDGVVNVFDIVLCRKALIDGYYDAGFLSAADINKDGVVTIADLLRMTRFVSGKSKNYDEIPDVQPSTGFNDYTLQSDYTTTWSKDGYNFEVWNQYSDGSAEIKDIAADGKCTFEWSDVHNSLLKSGMKGTTHNMERPINQIEDLVVDYDAEINANGDNIAAIYGWLEKPTIEWYIVEGWTGDEFPYKSESELIDDFDLDGEKYYLYKKEAGLGLKTFMFVKSNGALTEGKDHKLSGTVNVTEFIKNIRYYIDIDDSYDRLKLYDVNFLIEGLEGANGKAKINKNDITVSGIPFDEYYFSESSELLPDIDISEVNNYATEEHDGYTMYVRRSDRSSVSDQVYCGFGEEGGQMRGKWATADGAHYSSGLQTHREYPLDDSFMNDYEISYAAYAQWTGNFELGVGVTLEEPNVKVRIIDYWNGSRSRMHSSGNVIGQFQYNGIDYTVYREIQDAQYVYSFISSTGYVNYEDNKQKFTGDLKISEFLRKASQALELDFGEEAEFVGVIVDVDNGTGEFELVKNDILLGIKGNLPKFDVSEDQMKEVKERVTSENGDYTMEAFVSSGDDTRRNKAFYAFGENGGKIKGKWDAQEEVVYTSMKYFPDSQSVKKLSKYEVEYSAEIDCDNIYSLGAYALFTDKNVELEVISSWGAWRPSGSSPMIGTYTSNGKTYEVYKATYYGDLGMGGSIRVRYICIALNNYGPDVDTGLYSGRINVTDAINAVVRCGGELGELTAVGTKFEAFNSKGEFTLSRNRITKDYF